MRGLDNILSLRRSGFKPAYVWLQDADIAPTDLSVTLAKTDNPDALDLRCFVGVTVLAESDDRGRLGRMLRACQAASAKRVITNLHKKIDDFTSEIIEITDTDGVATWQK